MIKDKATDGLLAEVLLLSREEIDARIEQAAQFLHTNPPLAVEIIDDTIAHAERRNYELGLARAIRLRGVLRGGQGRLEEAGADFLFGLEYSRIFADLRLEAQCLHGLANVSYFRGEYEPAMEQCLRAIALWREVGDPEGLGRSLNSIAAFLCDHSHYAESLVYLAEGLENARAAGDHIHVATLLANYANALFYTNRWDESRIQLEESVRIAEASGDQSFLPAILTNLAATYVRLNRLEDALYTCERALTLVRSQSNPHNMYRPLLNLASIYDALGSHDLAEQYFWESLKTTQSLLVPTATTEPLIGLGSFFKGRGKIVEAEKYLLQALEIEEHEGRHQHLTNIFRLLSEIAVQSEDYKTALEYFQKFRQAERERDQQHSTSLLAYQMAKLEVDRARREANLFRQRNQELIRLNTEKEAVLRELARQSNEDSLTGLYNRRYLFDWMEKAITQSQIEQTTLIVAIADLDNFKQINDRFLHQTGDYVLKTVAQIFRANVRETDVVARYGGEEFAIVFPGLHVSEARVVCERLRRELEIYPWQNVNTELKVTVSIGIADEVCPTADELLALADKHLYRAKETGKNRVI